MDCFYGGPGIQLSVSHQSQIEPDTLTTFSFSNNSLTTFHTDHFCQCLYAEGIKNRLYGGPRIPPSDPAHIQYRDGYKTLPKEL